MKDKYVFHNEKGLTCPKTKVLEILSYFEFPIYKNGMIHFKDISKVLMKKVFEQKNVDYKLGETV